MDTNNPSYRMKSLLDGSSTSLISHTIAEEEGGETEDQESDAQDYSGRFDSASQMDGGPDVACSACGFESTFVHDGMIPCLRCNTVFYCSAHCRTWDWNSGGHRKKCKQLLGKDSSHNSLEQQLHSFRSSGGGSETSASSIDAENLFESLANQHLGGSPTSTRSHNSASKAAEGPAAATAASNQRQQQQQQQQQQQAARDNTVAAARSAKKTLSSFLETPKAPPQSSALLPNPFGNLKRRDDYDDDDEHENNDEVGGGGGSGSFGMIDEESFCVSQLDGAVTAPLHAISEESQVSEAQTADASWRTKELFSPKKSSSARDSHHYAALDNDTVVEESEGGYSEDYDTQNAQALQDQDDLAYGVLFGMGQSNNSMCASYDDTNHDEMSTHQEQHDGSGLLELFDSKGTGSSDLLDPHDSDSISNASSQNSAESSSSVGSQNDASSTPGSSQNEAASSPGSSAATPALQPRRALGDRSDSDKSNKSMLKQFREVYNRSSFDSELGAGDFASPSQRSAASLRQFREVYNADDADTSMSSSDPSENENVRRSFLGSMHLDGVAGDDDVVLGAIIDLKHHNDAVTGGGISSQSSSSRSTLQQARERFQAKKETLNEALIHYKHKFGESAAVQALDKIAGVKDVKVDNGKDSKVDEGKDSKLDNDNEFQWERRSVPNKSPATSYSAYRDLLSVRPLADGPDVDGTKKTYNDHTTSRIAGDLYPAAAVQHDVTPQTDGSAKPDPRYGQYRNALFQQRRSNPNNARTSTTDDIPLSSHGTEADPVGQYTKHRRGLKNSPTANGSQRSAAGDDDEDAAPYPKHSLLSSLSPSQRENTPRSSYAHYRSTLSSTGIVTDTPLNAHACVGQDGGTGAFCSNDAFMESSYARYRSALAPPLLNASKQVPLSCRSRAPTDVAAIDDPAPYAENGKLFASRSSEDASAFFTRRENDSGSPYTKYRSTLNSASELADTQQRRSGKSVNALTESDYAMYRSALAPSLSNSLLEEAQTSSGSSRRSLVTETDKHDAAPHTKHRKLSDSSALKAASNSFSRIENDAKSGYTDYRSSLRSDSVITPTESNYAVYRSALAPSLSNCSLSRNHIEFRKDEHTFGETFSTTIPITTTTGSGDNTRLYSEYRRILSSSVTSEEVEPFMKAISASAYEQQSYLGYRQSLGLQSAIQMDAAGSDAASDRIADFAISSSVPELEPGPVSQYSAYRSMQRDGRGMPHFHALGGNSIAHSDSDSMEERSDEFLSEQKSNEPLSGRYSSYRASQSLALPSSDTQQKSSSDGGRDEATPSWYRKYRESLVATSAKHAIMSNKASILQDLKGYASDSPAGKSVYSNYRQKLRVRFQSRSDTDINNEKSSLEQRGQLDERSLLPDRTVEQSVDIETPEPSQSEPEAVASPTSRSTSSVTSNTDIDNADATLMPRYLYYKFSLDKVELAMKEPGQYEIEAQPEDMAEGNHMSFLEVGSNMSEVRESDSSVFKTKQSMSVGSGVEDLQIGSLDSETARDFAILGIDTSAAQCDAGHGSFLNTWQQVEQDITAVSEERAQIMALRAKPTPTFQEEVLVLPTRDTPHPIVSNQIAEASLGSGYRIDIDDPQHCLNGDGSTSSAEVHNDKPGIGRKLWLLFLRHGIPPFILCLLALGLALGIARTRRDFRSRDSSPSLSPSVVPADVRTELFNMIVNASFDKGRGIQTPSSPQLLAFNWLLDDRRILELRSTELILQRYALGCLYYSADGDSWLNKTDWLSDNHECSWYSRLSPEEVCDSGGRYTALDISVNNLGGTLPVELALLSSLKTINLTGGGGSASIGGVLPTQLGLLSRLEAISLRSNDLSGGLPKELGALTELRSMDLGMNQLSLDIPSELKNLSALHTMNLEMNRLTGDFPTEIAVLGSLETLALGSNRMTGRVQVGGKMSSLKVLSLEQNRFTSISTGLGDLVNLEILSMYETDVTGSLQSEISQLRSLKRLSLHSNRLFGRLPDFIGDLSQLQDLDLSFNAFSGPIPTQIGRLSNLISLDLRSNFLAGSIPDQLGLLTAATSIRVDDNDISGTVSVALCSSYESLQPMFYLDCGSPEITCPPKSQCCTFCCNDGDGCDCALDAENQHLCFAD